SMLQHTAVGFLHGPAFHATVVHCRQRSELFPQLGAAEPAAEMRKMLDESNAASWLVVPTDQSKTPSVVADAAPASGSPTNASSPAAQHGAAPPSPAKTTAAADTTGQASKADDAKSDKARKRVEFYFGDERDEQLHSVVPGGPYGDRFAKQ